MTQVSQLQSQASRVVVLALVMIAGTAVAGRAATASWDRNIETDVAGYKLSYGTQSGVHTVTVDVGNVTTFEFNPPSGTRYYVVVQAYNVSGQLSEKSAEAILDVAASTPTPVLSIQPTNLPPVLAQPANQTSSVNANISLTLSASDPEGKPLQFTASNLPKGLSLDRTSGLISGRIKGTGTYQVVVTVSDGVQSASRSFTWTVTGGSGKSSSGEIENVGEVPGSRFPAPDALDDYVDVSGDFDGDGRADLATYRQSSSEWRIWTSSSNFGAPTVMVWGEAGDRPVPADYNGDRVTDFAVYRPSTGTWYLSLSGSQTPMAFQWGGAEDVPVPLDHDGDGKADLAVIRDGGYDILLSSANYLKSVQVR